MFLYSYLNVDQFCIDKIIKDNNYNINLSKDRASICQEYAEINGIDRELKLSYSYDDDMDFHRLYSYFNLNELKHLDIPENIHIIYTKDDAINMYNDICQFLDYSKELKEYKKWLLITSKYCDEYNIE